MAESGLPAPAHAAYQFAAASVIETNRSIFSVLALLKAPAAYSLTEDAHTLTFFELGLTFFMQGKREAWAGLMLPIQRTTVHTTNSVPF